MNSKLKNEKLMNVLHCIPTVFIILYIIIIINNSQLQPKDGEKTRDFDLSVSDSYKTLNERVLKHITSLIFRFEQINNKSVQKVEVVQRLC